MPVDELDLQFPRLTLGRVVTRRYQLAYAYRMINTRQVDEYVEQATINVSLSIPNNTDVRWSVDYEPEQIDYVGSPEAVQFFQWQAQQCQQRPQFLMVTDTHGLLVSVNSSTFQGATESQILAGHLAFISTGIWGSYPTSGRVREQLLPNHFGNIDLPILETLQADQTASGYTVTIAGQVDKGRFEQARFSRFVKNMTDIYDMRTAVELTHEVHYKLDREGLIERADAYTETEVANAYNVTYARTLTRLPQP